MSGSCIAESGFITGEESLELIDFQSEGGIPSGRLAPAASKAMVVVSWSRSLKMLFVDTPEFAVIVAAVSTILV